MTTRGGNMNKGNRQTKRPSPLRTTEDEVRPYRPPVIIHTYSPEVIHVDAAKFSALVQSLTGRGQKRKPEASPKVRDFAQEQFSCASPSSSADSGVTRGAVEGLHGGFVSPRGPLASLEHMYQQGFKPSSLSATDRTTNLVTNAFLAAAAASAGPQYSSFFSNPMTSNFSPLPSPNLLSPNFMADLPYLSPGPYQGFEAFGIQSFLTSPGYGRYSGTGILPSPGSSSAYKDMAMMMSRD